jgi:hypothetical protein
MKIPVRPGTPLHTWLAQHGHRDKLGGFEVSDEAALEADTKLRHQAHSHYSPDQRQLVHAILAMDHKPKLRHRARKHKHTIWKLTWEIAVLVMLAFIAILLAVKK